MAAKRKRASRAKRTRRMKPKITLTFEYRGGKRPVDAHAGTKRALALTVLLIALALSATAFYDSAYYSTIGYATANTNAPDTTVFLSVGLTGLVLAAWAALYLVKLPKKA